MGGLNRRVVDSKWPGFRSAFKAFEPSAVAAMTPADVDRLALDDRVIKYRAKLQAVVDNAERILELGRDRGSFAQYVETQLAETGLAATAAGLAKNFAYISEQGALHWLYSMGHDIGPVTDKVRAKYAPYDSEGAEA